MTTDGHKPYLDAVENAFGADVDYAVLQKLYGTAPEAIGTRVGTITGDPDPKHISMHCAGL